MKTLFTNCFYYLCIIMMLVALVLDPWEFLKWFGILAAPWSLGFFMGVKYARGEVR